MSDPLVLINPFSIPAGAVDGFIERWAANTEDLRTAQGFGGTALHRAISPSATFQLVNIATWESEEAWRDATGNRRIVSAPAPGDQQRPGITPYPALYRVIAE